MRGISILFFSFKQAFKNIRQNRMFTLATVGTISACLFLFGIFYFVISNFQYMIHSAETSVGVTVFFEEGITQEQIDEIGVKIQTRAEVDRIQFVSAEEAWNRFKGEAFGDADELADTFAEDNPLKDSASYEIYLNEIAKQKSLVKYMEKIEGVRRVNSADTTASSLHNINLLVGYVSIAIIIILLVVAIFLISTTITMGISVRKEEIQIMRLIGATDFFIRAPFIVEGVYIGIMGACIPLVLLFFMYQRIINYVSAKFAVLSNILIFLDAHTVFVVLIPLSLLVGIGIGFLGSAWTVRKHLYA